jgi:exosortase H (IPTLxxWG-CTERM-specific)
LPRKRPPKPPIKTKQKKRAEPAPGRIPRLKQLVHLLRDNLPIVRFVLVTFVALVALFYILHLKWVIQYAVDPYTHFVTSFSRVCLRLVGVEAGGTGNTILSPQFSVSIKNICNGLEVTAIFFATILGFPASWKSKLLGLCVGYPVIFLINILRIMVLFILGFKVPHVFEAAHYYYAQAFVIIATVGVWLFWVSTYSAYGSKTHHSFSD